MYDAAYHVKISYNNEKIKEMPDQRYKEMPLLALLRIVYIIFCTPSKDMCEGCVTKQTAAMFHRGLGFLH